MTDAENIIEVRKLENVLAGSTVHKDLDFTVKRGTIVGIVGGSGSGKTTLIRSILMLQKPVAGEVKVFGQNLWECNEAEAIRIRERWGMLFQKSALFSSLTLMENVMFPLQEFTDLPDAFIKELAKFKIALVGLPMTACSKLPGELSGGMLKRAAAARAIALDPELLFLDEPTSGLDPKSAQEMDELILKLRNSMGLTIVIVTHDLESLARVTDEVAFIGDGKVLAMEPLKQLEENPHPLIQEYFSSLKRV